jgi:hypothetical protein
VTIVGHDDPLHERVQLQMLVSLAGRLAHDRESLADGGRFPRGDIRLRAAPPERDARQSDDVGFSAGQGEQTRGIAPDDDGRMGALDRDGMDPMSCDSIVATGEGERPAREQPLDDHDRLGRRSTPVPAGSRPSTLRALSVHAARDAALRMFTPKRTASSDERRAGAGAIHGHGGLTGHGETKPVVACRPWK